MLQLGPNLSLPHLLHSLGTHTSVLNELQLIHLIHYQHSIFSPGFPSFQLPAELLLTIHMHLLLCGPFALQKTIGVRQVTSSHIVARTTPAQGSLPSMATRHDTWRDSWRPLISEFQLWEFSHYMTVLVLAERNHLSCHAVKLESLRSSTAPWLFHLKTGAMG